MVTSRALSGAAAWWRSCTPPPWCSWVPGAALCRDHGHLHIQVRPRAHLFKQADTGSDSTRPLSWLEIKAVQKLGHDTLGRTPIRWSWQAVNYRTVALALFSCIVPGNIWLNVKQKEKNTSQAFECQIPIIPIMCSHSPEWFQANTVRP